MSFSEFIATNYVMIYELVGILIILIISSHISASIKKYTRYVILLIFTTATVNALELWTQTFSSFNIWRFILTGCKYTLYPIILMLLIGIVTRYNKVLPLKVRIALCIPELISIPLYFTSQWSKLIYYFTEDNIYHGGPLQYFPYVVFAFYIVVFIVVNISFLKYYSFKNRIFLFYIVIGAVLCVILYLSLQIYLDYSPVLTSGLVFYYLFIYIHMANVDPLTKLLNRQSYYQDISDKGYKISAVVSVDMNNLKKLNDQFGHAEGDKAIKDVADVLREELQNRATAYRVGGDEFAVFYRQASKEDVDNYIKALRDRLNKTNRSCAIGYAMTSEFMSVDDAIKEADKRMYMNKYYMKIDADRQNY